MVSALFVTIPSFGTSHPWKPQHLLTPVVLWELSGLSLKGERQLHPSRSQPSRSQVSGDKRFRTLLVQIHPGAKNTTGSFSDISGKERGRQLGSWIWGGGIGVELLSAPLASHLPLPAFPPPPLSPMLPSRILGTFHAV